VEGDGGASRFRNRSTCSGLRIICCHSREIAEILSHAFLHYVNAEITAECEVIVRAVTVMLCLLLNIDESVKALAALIRTCLWSIHDL
jgi:hypothetical protein